MLKMLKSKRGISPILATLLLIVIAVAAIIVTYAWVMTFMGAQSGTAGTLFKVINVYWDGTNNQTKIDIQNYGTSTAKIVSLYIGTSANNLLEVTLYTDIGEGKTIEVEETKTVTLDWPNVFDSIWTNGEDYYLKIAPESGSAVTSGPHEAYSA